VGLDVLANRDDLADFARFAVDVPVGSDEATDGTAAAADDRSDERVDVVPDCGYDIVAGIAVYRDQEVLVGIDVDRQLAVAFLADCTVVDRASID